MKIFALYVRLMETADFFVRADIVEAATKDKRLSSIHHRQLLHLARQMNRRDDARECQETT